MQRLARTKVHLHPAGGHQRYAGELRNLLQTQGVACILRGQAACQAQPNRCAVALAGSHCDGACFFYRQVGLQQHNDFVVIQRGPGIKSTCDQHSIFLRLRLPAQFVLPLGRGTAGAGDEFAQITPALQIVRQRHEAKQHIPRPC